MAEAAPAKKGAPSTDPITITWSQALGYGIQPPVDSSVAFNGAVVFTTPKACKIWTCVNGSPANVFLNQTGFYVSVNPKYTGTVNEPVGTVITFQPTPESVVVTPPCPTILELSVKGTITVGSMAEKKNEKE